MKNRLLYLGSDTDLSPILLYPDIKEFVYIDQLPRNYESHWGITYYKGLYIPQYRPDTKGNMIDLLVKKMRKHFTHVKVNREGDLLTIYFDKNKKLTYWLNTLLPEFTDKNQFKTIKEIKSPYYSNSKKDLQKMEYYSDTNLTKEIIDDMLKCNILYIRGYYPSFPILQMLHLDKIITQDVIIEYYISNNKSKSRGKKYGEIDLRKPLGNYKPPKMIEHRDDLYIDNHT